MTKDLKRLSTRGTELIVIQCILTGITKALTKEASELNRVILKPNLLNSFTMLLNKVIQA